MPDTIHYDSPVASITLDNEGIFIFKLKDTYIAYNGIELEKHFILFLKHSKEKAYKVLIDATESVNLPTDDAGFYFRENNRPEDRFAIVSNSLPVQIFMGQLIKQREVKNIKLFKNREEAMEWLTEDTLK